MSSDEFFDPNHSSIFISCNSKISGPDGLNAVLSIALVSVKELGVTTERQEDPDILIELSAEILGIPNQSFLDETQYRRVNLHRKKQPRRKHDRNGAEAIARSYGCKFCVPVRIKSYQI